MNAYTISNIAYNLSEKIFSYNNEILSPLRLFNATMLVDSMVVGLIVRS